jgi:hypothetical protein
MASPAVVPPAENDVQKTRLRLFVNLFKSYMSIMPLVTAALAPLLTAMNVLPLYKSQREPLATMAGLLGFLLLAWLFYVRRTIALGSITRGLRWFFNVVPLLLILSSIGCYVFYVRVLDTSVITVQQSNPTMSRSDVLSKWSDDHPAPGILELQLLYLGMFLAAEAAFVMMALREYANDVRGITEYQWMYGVQDGSAPKLDDDAAPEAAGLAAAKTN